ncbi:MAG: histidinol-phosphate transaminase [Acidobacteria bacterium]|nr:histidinol-phosphate transaminase [Acidobacteriota bacterium]
MPPRFRSDLERIQPYRPGRSIADVAAEFGVQEVAKLASNENPEPPFPEVQQAIAASLGGLNRYPDNAKPDLTAALADHLGVEPERIWCGGASNELTLITALSMGGPATSAVYAWPSFELYRIGSLAIFSDTIEVPLDDLHRHDLDAMQAAIRDDTTVVYICNPNNPTSTVVAGDALERFIDAVSDDILIVVDEAYHEYATAEEYRSMLPLAVERSNVLVTRTFSKVYSLAGLRVGYAVTAPQNIAQLRRIQLPFSVSNLAEVAAVEALKHQDRVAERHHANRAGIAYLTSGLRHRRSEVADSQTNFVYASFEDAAAVNEGLLQRGVIVRPVTPDGWLRINTGTHAEMERFFLALDEVQGERQ